MPSGKSSRAGLWLPLLVWMSLIFLFSTDIFSGSETGGIILPVFRFLLRWAFSEQVLNILHHLLRKGAHLTEYAVLGLLWYRALNLTIREWNSRAAFQAFILSAFYAATDEFHQTFTLTRDGRVADVIIDSTGVVMAIAALWVYNNLIKGLNNEHR